MPRAEDGRRPGIGAELARRARRAVLRVLEVADEIVVLEWRDGEKRRVERDAYPAEKRPIVSSRSEHPS